MSKWLEAANAEIAQLELSAATPKEFYPPQGGGLIQVRYLIEALTGFRARLENLNRG